MISNYLSRGSNISQLIHIKKSRKKCEKQISTFHDLSIINMRIVKEKTKKITKYIEIFCIDWISRASFQLIEKKQNLYNNNL